MKANELYSESMKKIYEKAGTNLQKIKSFYRNELRCPLDFIEENERAFLAIKRALKYDNSDLFEEVTKDLVSRYDHYCTDWRLYKNDDNRRIKFKIVPEDQYGNDIPTKVLSM